MEEYSGYILLLYFEELIPPNGIGIHGYETYQEALEEVLEQCFDRSNHLANPLRSYIIMGIPKSEDVATTPRSECDPIKSGTAEDLWKEYAKPEKTEQEIQKSLEGLPSIVVE